MLLGPGNQLILEPFLLGLLSDQLVRKALVSHPHQVDMLLVRLRQHDSLGRDRDHRRAGQQGACEVILAFFRLGLLAEA